MPAQVVAAAAAHVGAVDVAGDGHRACSSCAGVLRHYRRWQGQQQGRQCGDESCQAFKMCFILKGGGSGNVSSWYSDVECYSGNYTNFMQNEVIFKLP